MKLLGRGRLIAVVFLATLPVATGAAVGVRPASLAPHRALTQHFMDRIDTEGRITTLGPDPAPPVRDDDGASALPGGEP